MNPKPIGEPHDFDNLSQIDLDALTRGECPTCRSRGFILGPRGGVAQNIECANLECRARFNVTTFGGHCLLAQRIPREREGGNSWPCPPTAGTGHKGTFS